MVNTKLNIMTKVSVFAGIAFVLMRFFEFPFPLLWPDFLKFDFSDVPALIIGFAISPAAGCAVVLIKNALFLLTGFNFIGVGANLCAGIAFTFVSSFVYSHNKTMKRAVISIIYGILAMTVVMIPVNMALVRVWGIPENAAAKIVWIVIPSFNIVKGLLEGFLTYVSYKKISTVFLKIKNDMEIINK
ncbi:MAG: ECF transporter S component [Candidatus Wallbacteria bacterium]